MSSYIVDDLFPSHVLFLATRQNSEPWSLKAQKEFVPRISLCLWGVVMLEKERAGGVS